MTHIALRESLSGKVNHWMEHISDEQCSMSEEVWCGSTTFRVR